MTYKTHFSEVPEQSQICLCSYAEKNAGANQESWAAAGEELRSVWAISSSQALLTILEQDRGSLDPRHVARGHL